MIQTLLLPETKWLSLHVENYNVETLDGRHLESRHPQTKVDVIVTKSRKRGFVRHDEKATASDDKVDRRNIVKNESDIAPATLQMVIQGTIVTIIGIDIIAKIIQ